MRDELVLQLICEEFEYDKLPEELDNILLEDESPIKLIGDLDSDKDVQKESDKESKEVEDLVGIDDLIDKMEENSDDEDLSVNINPDRKLNLKLIDNIEDDLKVDLNDDKIKNIQLVIKKFADKIVSDDKSDLSLNITDNDNINNQSDDSNDIKVNINNDTDKSDITVNVNDDASSKESKSDINVNVKSKSEESSKDSDYADVKIKLKNSISYDQEDKTTLFIKKRDDLIQNGNPNMQLSVCLKVIVELKKSLDRLINFIPDEIILVRTKYIIGDMIDSILESSDSLLKDDEKLKDLIYKVFDLVISINEYITTHYIHLEDKLDKQDKPEEDKQISKQLKDVEDKTKEEKKQENDVDTDDNFSTSDLDIKEPNINKQKI